jgi:uncharacterized protein YlxW (UPF0749 family)
MWNEKSERLRQELDELQQSAQKLKDHAKRLDEKCNDLQTQIERGEWIIHTSRYGAA